MNKDKLFKLQDSLGKGKVIVIVTKFTNYLLVNKDTMISKNWFHVIKRL